MTVSQASYFDWPTSGIDYNAAPYDVDAPGIVTVMNYLCDMVGGVNMGIRMIRPRRSGSKMSVHAWAAGDWRWGYHPDVADWPNTGFLTRDEVLPVIDQLVGWSAELGIQHIMDEGRSWMAYRSNGNLTDGWQTYNSGYGGWIHFETGLEARNDGRPVPVKIAPDEPSEEDDMVPYIMEPSPAAAATGGNWPWFYKNEHGIWEYCDSDTNDQHIETYGVDGRRASGADVRNDQYYNVHERLYPGRPQPPQS